MDKQEECLRAKDSVLKASRSFVDRWWWIEKRENEGAVAQEEGGGVGIEGTISLLEANVVPRELAAPFQCLPSLGQS